MEKFYISPLRVTPRIQDLVNDGDVIKIDGERYVNLTKRPKNTSVLRKLTNVEDDSIKITIYK